MNCCLVILCCSGSRCRCKWRLSVSLAVSWASTHQWCWWLGNSSASSSAASHTPSCSKSFHASTASSNSAPTSSSCGKPASWSWRRTCTPNSSSFTARQRPWSNGRGRRPNEPAGIVGNPEIPKKKDAASRRTAALRLWDRDKLVVRGSTVTYRWNSCTKEPWFRSCRD